MQFNCPVKFNIADFILKERGKKSKENPIVIYYGDEKITYNKLEEMTNKAGNALLDIGVRREDRVLLLLLDTPEFYYSFLGAIKIGAVPIPTNTMLKPQDYEFLLNDSRAAAIIVSEQLVDMVYQMLPLLPYLKSFIVAGKAKGEQLSFDEIVNKASDKLEAVESHKDDPCFWLYSSGSTGTPKGTVHLQHDIYHCGETYGKKILKLTEKDITFSAARLFFAYGLGNNFYFPIFAGASAVLNPERPVPEKMFQIIDKYKVTVFFGVPTLYAAMLQVKEVGKKYDLSSLRLCISAGEALPPEILKNWKEKFGVEICDGIGSTEMLHIFISNIEGDIMPGSSGKPVPGYNIKIVDDEGNPVKKGEIGNMLASGDSAAAYYWKSHEKTKNTFQGKWVVSGDKYYQDENGYYFYCGRADDMLKVGGIWVSPVEVENTVITHPSVLECAVVGAADKDNLIKPKAFVVLKEGIEPSDKLIKEIQLFVKEKIAPYKYPRWIEFIKELPKTPTGKIQRFKLRG